MSLNLPFSRFSLISFASACPILTQLIACRTGWISLTVLIPTELTVENEWALLIPISEISQPDRPKFSEFPLNHCPEICVML
jgi:hypothetical protein